MFILTALIFAACKTDHSVFVNEDYVSNFKLGMVCPNPEGEKYGEESRGIGTGTICRTSDEFVIKGGQTCIYDRQPVDCTWYGYSFDFKNLDNEELDCNYSATLAGNEGNPDGVRVENAKSADFELDLPGTSGHFYNPLYTASVAGVSTETRNEIHTSCRHNGAEIFSIKYTVIYPVSD